MGVSMSVCVYAYSSRKCRMGYNYKSRFVKINDSLMSTKDFFKRSIFVSSIH